MSIRWTAGSTLALSCGGHASLDPQGGDAVIAFALPD